MIASGSGRPFRVTLVHPCVGRTVGMKRYIRTWKMQPLPVATIAGLLPTDVERRFYDDRLEAIPYDEPTDLVLISIETYTARRSYQIASEFRRRGVPVAMGGFHATLCTDEVARFAESVVGGEAEQTLPGRAHRGARQLPSPWPSHLRHVRIRIRRITLPRPRTELSMVYLSHLVFPRAEPGILRQLIDEIRSLGAELGAAAIVLGLPVRSERDRSRTMFRSAWRTRSMIYAVHGEASPPPPFDELPIWPEVAVL